jgi:hypothetical protein
MRFRKLRIAWSVAWGVVAVLLIVLWVRSYDRGYRFWEQQAGIEAGIGAEGGTVFCWRMDRSADGHADFPWTFTKWNAGRFPRQFVFEHSTFGTATQCPTWVLLIMVAAAGSTAWVRRFSLRTLLIVTTLVAVVLGLIVWATNSVKLNTLGGPTRIVNEHGRLIEK